MLFFKATYLNGKLRLPNVDFEKFPFVLVVPCVNDWSQTTETVEITDLKNYCFYIKSCIATYKHCIETNVAKVYKKAKCCSKTISSSHTTL